MELELKLGFMTNQELAEWAGLKEDYIRKHKKNWCNRQLVKYATYDVVRGGVNINSIIDPIYSSTGKTQVKKEFKNCWGTPNFRVDTCRNAARKMKKRLQETGAKVSLSDNTIYSYVNDTKRCFYGVPKKREGIYGYSRWVMCKVIDGQATPFTEDEEELKKELMHKYLKNDCDKILDIQAAYVNLEKGDITPEEYSEVVNEIVERELGWEMFETEFTKAIGAPIDFQTELVDNIIKIIENDGQDFTF